MAENIENKGFSVYNAETDQTGDETMDANKRKKIEYLIIILISVAVLAAGWINRETIAEWAHQKEGDTVQTSGDAAETENLILEINSVDDYLAFVQSVNTGNTYCHASNYSSHLRQFYRRLNSASPSYCLS